MGHGCKFHLDTSRRSKCINRVWDNETKEKPPISRERFLNQRYIVFQASFEGTHHIPTIPLVNPPQPAWGPGLTQLLLHAEWWTSLRTWRKAGRGNQSCHRTCPRQLKPSQAWHGPVRVIIDLLICKQSTNIYGLEKTCLFLLNGKECSQSGFPERLVCLSHHHFRSKPMFFFRIISHF